MKKLIAVLVLVLAAGCQTSNQYGECKGLFNEEEKSPAMSYEMSVRNIIFAAIFSETLLWPILTAGFWVWCPVPKAATAATPTTDMAVTL